MKFAQQQHEAFLAELRQHLDTLRLADLRGAARNWGWTVRGNAKADVVEAILAYLADASCMSAAFATLPALEQEVLVWCQVLSVPNVTAQLRAVLQLAANSQLDQAAVQELLDDLVERCLLFHAGAHLAVPTLFAEWLPPSAAPGLAMSGLPPEPVATISAEQLAQEVDDLLAFIGAGSYAAVPAGTESEIRQAYPTPAYASRPGVLPAETLETWGYASGVEQDRATFLLALMLRGDLIRANPSGGKLMPTAQNVSDWQELAPVERQRKLQAWWLLEYQEATRPLGSRLRWHELDLALRGQEDYQLRTPGWYVDRTWLENDVAMCRASLAALLRLLTPAIWYGVGRFLELMYGLQRDLLHWNERGVELRWYRGKTALEPSRMDLATWRATYGLLVQAFVAGPAQWLGYLQVAGLGSIPVAFLCPPEAEAQPAALPSDALRFRGDEIVVRNLWQASGLRRHLGRLAVEAGRTRQETFYHIDAAAFRRTLHEGIGAGDVIRDFAAAGFPLPESLAERLRRWQAIAGRHQIYENVSLIEFADELTAAEIQAATSLGRANIFAATPRSLVVLDPEIIPALLDELRRKGYTPQVLP